ncbi:hypothetical protein M3G47_07745 [Corynebacterium sanguinis]|uniref:hypothetical protein n=1 Tax=Corynebacterium sanguinis TaxID=2594913 RepID=UPI0021A6A859|nr:hypothetical protein [Corynebacterium sanguinis]MCT1492821.1 hypothetical protein [Corynebacterium sanguinis]MCT2247967.1 hypothetical protein [Corynebacterium sanguinis]
MRPALLFVAVAIAAINLRAGMASVGAVLDDVLAHYNAPASIGGVITAMPGALFCVFGLSAVPLARRVGLTPTLLAAAIATAAGLALRPFVPMISLFILATISVAGGIALVNVLLPAWIKKYGGAHIVALTTIYSATVSVSAPPGTWAWCSHPPPRRSSAAHLRPRRLVLPAGAGTDPGAHPHGDRHRAAVWVCAARRLHPRGRRAAARRRCSRLFSAGWASPPPGASLLRTS